MEDTGLEPVTSTLPGDRDGVSEGTRGHGNPTLTGFTALSVCPVVPPVSAQVCDQSATPPATGGGGIATLDLARSGRPHGLDPSAK